MVLINSNCYERNLNGFFKNKLKSLVSMFAMRRKLENKN